jgi:hypothetical protein
MQTRLLEGISREQCIQAGGTLDQIFSTPAGEVVAAIWEDMKAGVAMRAFENLEGKSFDYWQGFVAGVNEMRLALDLLRAQYRKDAEEYTQKEKKTKARRKLPILIGNTSEPL